MDNKISPAAALQALSVASSTYDILHILNRTERNENVSIMAVKMLSLGQKKEAQIMEILAEAYYNDQICIASIPLISEDNIVITLKGNSYKESVCLIALPLLKLKGNIVEVMKKQRYSTELAQIGFSLLQQQIKTEQQWMDILDELGYPWQFSQHAITMLKSEENIIKTMEGDKLYDPVCEAGIPLLHLAAKTEDELIALFKRFSHLAIGYRARSMIIPFFKFEQKNNLKVMEILKKIDYEHNACQAAILVLSLEEDILTVMDKTGYNYLVCDPVLPKVKQFFEQKTEEQLMATLAKFHYGYSITAMAVPLLKTDRNIYTVMEGSNYNPNVTSAAAKQLHFETRSEAAIMDILLRVHYDKNVAVVGITFLKDSRNILEVMRQTKYDEKVCNAVKQTV